VTEWPTGKGNLKRSASPPMPKTTPGLTSEMQQGMSMMPGVPTPYMPMGAPQVNKRMMGSPGAGQPLPRKKAGPGFKPSDLVKKGRAKGE